MCCGRICMMCTCLIVVVIAIGMLFGFGVFSKAFHKVNNDLHYSYPPSAAAGRPFVAFAAPPPKNRSFRASYKEHCGCVETCSEYRRYEGDSSGSK
ncbi:hypothetical protein L1987_55757 [Smallanthus sonchifolius]|uniref:Uncharacterized protein n=1 Tax=Smallanthus sonchifolius TaxID=185202 RepID=A0ACB9EAW8_9ASTR|nr:hypothetical protein L1987_55757 [Smallanthus sonchifolius]